MFFLKLRTIAFKNMSQNVKINNIEKDMTEIIFDFSRLMSIVQENFQFLDRFFDYQKINFFFKNSQI